MPASAGALEIRAGAYAPAWLPRRLRRRAATRARIDATPPPGSTGDSGAPSLHPQPAELEFAAAVAADGMNPCA
jgi:hypothetical protein